jgi:hypothetical protein
VHDEGSAARRREARAAGGRTRLRPRATLPPDTPDVPLLTLDDCKRAIEATFNLVRRGQVDVKVGNALGFLVGVQRSIVVGVEQAAEIERLRELLEGGVKRQAEELQQLRQQLAGRNGQPW